MDKQREAFVKEMRRMKEAIEKTDSPKLKRDYSKAIKRMKKQLKEYDYYRQGRNA